MMVDCRGLGIERPRLLPIRHPGYDIPRAGHVRVIAGGARVEQIPTLRYIVVGAGIASEGGAGGVAACAKIRKTNPITWSFLNDLAFLWAQRHASRDGSAGVPARRR
jgi:hypothetical protein